MTHEENVFGEYEWDDLEILNEELCAKAGYQYGTTSDGYDKRNMTFTNT